MKILLAYLAKPKYGGWPTFTAHLYRGLRAAGHEPMLVKHGNHTEPRLRNYGRKMNYQNLSSADLTKAASQLPMLITAVDKHHHPVAATLISQGVPIVIHDPTELKQPITDLALRGKVIVIREAMLKHLPHATFIKHPYARHTATTTNEKHPAASISRIDFDKHTEIIVNANRNLAQPVHIYGFLNTVYAHFNLKPIDPEWQRNYHGRFNADDLWAAKRIAQRYERIVDMSIIKGDGGGTQYTFLEAADSGAALILNEGWQPRGDLAAYAHTVSTHQELTTKCVQPIDPHASEAAHLLRQHDAATIAQHYAQLLT